MLQHCFAMAWQKQKPCPIGHGFFGAAGQIRTADLNPYQGRELKLTI